MINKPKCVNYKRCKNEALSLVNGMWVCGECLIRLTKELKELKEDILINGNYQSKK